MKYPKPKIGDVIYIVPFDDRKEHYEATVTKVGTAFFYSGNPHERQVGLNTWRVSDPRGLERWGCVAAAYPSKETYDGIQRRKVLWAKIVNKDGSGILAEFELEDLLRRLS